MSIEHIFLAVSAYLFLGWYFVEWECRYRIRLAKEAHQEIEITPRDIILQCIFWPVFLIVAVLLKLYFWLKFR